MHVAEFHKTKRLFLIDLGKYIVDINIPTSLSKSRYTIQLSNKTVFARNMGDLLQTLNTLIGETLFITGRLVGRQGFKVIVDKDVSEKLLAKGSPAKVKVEEVVTKTSEKAVQEESEVETEVIVETVEEASVTEGVTKTDIDVVSEEVDWEWINSLKNTKEDKKAFDEWAEEKHSISLKRNMKIENMIAVFKEEFEAK